MSERDRYATIVIVGGGCYGSFYLRQLFRARAAGALTWDRVVVVDRNPDCAAAQSLGDAQLAVADWTSYFREYLGSADEADAIVPSPLMPHLMYEWVRDRAKERWPDREITTRPLPSAPPTPWERAAPDGVHYVSFATWMCPINCIEPATCPHTKGPRTWTMPATIRDYVTQERIAGPALFHVTHRAYGVGMLNVADVLAADRLVEEVAEDKAAQVLVGTVSHCHGALAVLSIGNPVRFQGWRSFATTTS
ncbi:MAG TPA: hypothetical protein VNV25_24685 [Gemmatimonadaceae bacterium]|jgi:hypothetical protein|nr:hypothetical protein [Gemmatimonadaceae bacterium]